MCYADVTDRIARARAEWEATRDISAIRASFDALFATPGTQPATSEKLGGLPALRIGAGTGTPVLYFHGGGFQIGSMDSHRGIMEQVAAQSGRPVLGIDYPLSPEHRFPVAIEAALTAYAALQSQGCGTVSLAGDSAGANMALAVFQLARARGIALPDRIVLISPWFDLALSGESYDSRQKVDIFSTPAALRAMARSYLGRAGDPGDPLASPVAMTDFTRLPPVLIHVGDSDITLSDSQTFANRARSAGAAVTLRVWPGMFHHFQMFPELPESGESLDDIGVFLRN